MLFIHGHIWIISSIATEYDIPLIITSHGSDIMGYHESNKFHKHADKAMAGSKKIIAISNKNKQKVNEIYSEYKDKIITIPNGYNPDLFYRENDSKEEILKSFNISKKYDKVVCFAGRLAENKGVDILLNSAKIYEKDNVLTLIAGAGSEYKTLNLLKEKLKLRNVVFMGDQNHEALRKIYSSADVCVVPSREEAFGLVALEAIACGTPVIATKEGGMADFITKDVGILIEKENIEQLAKEVNRVLSGEKKFDTKYLQSYAKENYSQENLMNQLIEIYEEVRKSKNVI